MRIARAKRWSIALLALAAVTVAGVVLVVGRHSGPELAMTSESLIAPWAMDYEYRRAQVTITEAPSRPVSVTIWHDGRLALSFDNVKIGDPVYFRINEQFAEGSWSAKATSGSTETSAPIDVALRWAPMSARTQRFERCGVVRWSLNTTGAPPGSSSVVEDISAALEEISMATGLTFTRVEDEAQADLRYSWGALGAEWSAGSGGSRITDEGTNLGFVELSRDSEWARRPGFAYSDRKPGQGILLLHETGHALGLGHVNDQSQIMFPTPVEKGPSHLGVGDRAGLAWLYHPEDCAK